MIENSLILTKNFLTSLMLIVVTSIIMRLIIKYLFFSKKRFNILKFLSFKITISFFTLIVILAKIIIDIFLIFLNFEISSNLFFKFFEICELYILSR